MIENKQYKSGFVTIVGRPNVGKSTLTNQIMGEKLSIVSNKPQTTRNNIQTILTGDDYQLVFVDTPGIHKPKNKLGDYMVNAATSSIKEVDLVVNTPTKGNDSKRDGFLIRRAAIERNIGVITALDTLRAIADVKVSEIDKRDLEVFNIAE